MITPAGGFSLAHSSVRNLIAWCPTWHTWTGADELMLAPPVTGTQRFDASILSVYLWSVPNPADSDKGYTPAELAALRPYAVVTARPPLTVSRTSDIYVRKRNSNAGFVENYNTYINIVAAVDPDNADSHQDAYMDFSNRIGSLIDEMLVPYDREDLPNVLEVGMVLEPSRTTEDYFATQGDLMQCALRLMSGLRR